jgi:hypothetical protein
MRTSAWMARGAVAVGLATAVVAAAVGTATAVRAEGEASEARRGRLVGLARKLGLLDRVHSQARAELRVGGKEPSAAFWAAVDWTPLEDFFADELGRNLDDASLDASVAYLESPEGARFLLQRKLGSALDDIDGLLRDGLYRGETADRKKRLGAALDKAFEKSLQTMPRVVAGVNETAAIATLRNLAACQAQVQASGKIDADHDGIGEYATFLELTGSVGVRSGLRLAEGAEKSTVDFSARGSPIAPAILSPSLAAVNEAGIVTKAGYCFRIFLPDAAFLPGFVHETGPAETVGLEGGTGRVGVDFSETMWCAYAWPIVRGKSGNRAFFVNQAGDVLQSANEVAKWDGVGKPVAPDAAFLRGGGKGIAGRIAVGTAGKDGDVWKVTN